MTPFNETVPPFHGLDFGKAIHFFILSSSTLDSTSSNLDPSVRGVIRPN